MLKNSRPASRRLALLALVVAMFAVPATASAVTVTKIYAGPIAASSSCNPDGAGAVPALQAAAYADFCFAFRAQKVAAGGDDLKTTVIDSPQGVWANVDPQDQCEPAKFAATSINPAACGASTQVGQATATVRAALMPGLEIPLSIPGTVFDLRHTANEVGLLGIQLNPSLAGIPLPKSKILLRFTMRPAPDVGLRGVADNLPRTATLAPGIKLPIAIDTFGFRFWGSKIDHPSMKQSFSLTGSSCDTATTRFTGTAYSGQQSKLARDYVPTGCDQLAVGQTAEVTTSERRPDVPTETRVRIAPAKPADPLRQSIVNSGTSIVTLPPGLMLGAQAASGEGGLPLCTDAQFALESNAAPSCPAASVTANVTFDSPLQERPFVGKAYLGQQTGPNRLPQLMISADQGGTAADAPRVKLLGQLSIDEQGRLVTKLTGLPDVPFNTFDLTFRGGDHASLSTPPTCGTGTGASTIVPYSPQIAPNTVPLTLTIDEDCGAAGGFGASAGVTFKTTAAGADGQPTFTVSRPDRSARIRSVVMHLAPGMLASLKGVRECPAADAATGNCPAESRVGTVLDQAGVGPAPVTTPPGAVYLTERPAGAVAGLVFVSPVAFGAVDLGTLVVPARIDLRAADLGLDLSTEIPATFLGIPLNLRSFTVQLDRPGFSRNPTNCAALGVSADITAYGGATAASTTPVQMTGCDALPFAPAVSATLPAGTKPGDSPGLTTIVGSPGLQSALKKVTVTLPEGIAADLTKLSRACPIADFRAGGCSDAALTGTASGHLAILDEPVTGRVVLVKYPGESLPGIGLDLGGRFSARIEGHVKVAPSGRLVVTLDGLPDAPIDDLALTFNPGAPSALKVSDAFCPSGTTAFTFELVGQNGATTSKTVTQPCGTGGVLAARSHRSTITAKLTGRKTARPKLTVKITGPSGTRFTSARLVLGTGLAVPAANRKKISVAGGRTSVSGRRTLRVALRGTGRRTIALRLLNGTLDSTMAVRRSTRRIPIRLTLRYADGVVERRTVRVR
jgi:hypothetical protein